MIRIMDRDGKSREEAEKRVDSQLSNAGEQKDSQHSVPLFSKLSNAERVSWASTLLCTLWQPEVTQRQVEEAVERLQREMVINGTSS